LIRGKKVGEKFGRGKIWSGKILVTLPRSNLYTQSDFVYKVIKSTFTKIYIDLIRKH